MRGAEVSAAEPCPLEHAPNRADPAIRSSVMAAQPRELRGNNLTACMKGYEPSTKAY